MKCQTWPHASQWQTSLVALPVQVLFMQSFELKGCMVCTTKRYQTQNWTCHRVSCSPSASAKHKPPVQCYWFVPLIRWACKQCPAVVNSQHRRPLAPHRGSHAPTEWCAMENRWDPIVLLRTFPEISANTLSLGRKILWIVFKMSYWITLQSCIHHWVKHKYHLSCGPACLCTWICSGFKTCSSYTTVGGCKGICRMWDGLKISAWYQHHQWAGGKPVGKVWVLTLIDDD